MKLSKTAKNMILVIIASSAAFIVIAACVLSYYSFNLMAFSIGVLMGAALNVMKVIMLENTVNQAVRLEYKAASSYLRSQALLRFILTGVVLALAAIVPFINIWGAAAGIITLQIAAYSMKFFIRDEDENPSAEKTVEPVGQEKYEEDICVLMGEKNNDIEEAEGTADEDANTEEPDEPEDEEKRKIKRKPTGQRAEKRMKKKPTRRYK